MTFPARASSRCHHHHRLHFMAGIFQRPGSICIFKTSLMAWENCIFPVFLGTTLLTSSPIPLGLRLYALRSQKAPQSRAEQVQPPSGIIRRSREAREGSWEGVEKVATAVASLAT